VVTAGILDPEAVSDASMFADAVARAQQQGPAALIGVAPGRRVIFLGDELQHVYETAAAYPKEAARLIGELREAGKMGNVFVAISGSSTKMAGYTMTPSQELRNLGIVDLNHGIYGVLQVSPPRDVKGCWTSTWRRGSHGSAWSLPLTARRSCTTQVAWDGTWRGWS
jgi:hypothetical protein